MPRWRSPAIAPSGWPMAKTATMAIGIGWMRPMATEPARVNTLAPPKASKTSKSWGKSPPSTAPRNSAPNVA